MNIKQKMLETGEPGRRLLNLEDDDPRRLTVAFAHLKALCESRTS